MPPRQPPNATIDIEPAPAHGFATIAILGDDALSLIGNDVHVPARLDPALKAAPPTGEVADAAVPGGTGQTAGLPGPRVPPVYGVCGPHHPQQPNLLHEVATAGPSGRW